MSLSVLSHDGWDELVLSIQADPRETAAEALLRAISVLHRQGADLLRATVYCRVVPSGSPLTGPRGVPVTFVEGAPCGEALVAGVHAIGARGAPVAYYEAEHGAMAAVVEDGHGRWAYVTNVTPTALWAPPAMQAREAFERAEAILKLAGMTFRNVYRTWLYLDDLLGWYSDLNRVRTAFYRERGVFEGTVPASTGIGAANPGGAALTLDLLAVAPLDNRIRIRAAASPLQCAANDYGSAFSRAVEIEEPGLRRLLVSGTASIGKDGATLHVGDVEAQIEWTLDVVEGILRSADMDWTDINRAVAYFRRAKDADVLDDHAGRRGCPNLPVIVTQSIVCRDDLLFEIEVDAAK